MPAILGEPGLWVGSALAVSVVAMFGALRRAPWWRTGLTALGAVGFVAGMQWAWSLGPDAFLAAGLASLGMVVWGENLLSLIEARARPAIPVAIPIVVEEADRPIRGGTRRLAEAEPVPIAKPAARTKPVARAKPTAAKQAARAKPVTGSALIGDTSGGVLVIESERPSERPAQRRTRGKPD